MSPVDNGSSGMNETRKWAAVWSQRPAIARLCLFWVAYVLAAGFAQLLAIMPGTGISIWPPSGVFMATLILSRKPSWPWWVFAGLLAELFANAVWFGNPLVVAILLNAGNALEATAGAWLVLRFCRKPGGFETLRDVMALVVLGAGIAPIASATVGSATLAGFGIQSFATAWPLWWIGDATGILIVAPLALAAVQTWRERTRLPAARWVEGGILALVFLGVAAVSLSAYLPFAYLIMPPLLWIAVRFQFSGAAIALALLAMMTALFTVFGEGQFAGDLETPKQSHVLLQLFLAISALSALVVAAISQQYQQALKRLKIANIELKRRVSERTANIADSEARLRLALRAGRAGIWEHDLASDRSVLSESFFRLLGREPASNAAVSLEQWKDIIVPEDVAAVIEEWDRARRSHDLFISEYRIRRQDTGEIRYLHGTGEFTYATGGQASRFSGVVFDVTELKRHEQRQQMLINELSHRVKNTLATVQSIAVLSFRSRSGDGTADDFVARLMVLARGHDLLSRKNWDGAPLYELVKLAVAPHIDDVRIRAAGTEVWMPPRQALAMNMALHELCANAVKYGALSNELGRIEIAWEASDTSNRFRLTWRERGGPAVEPPEHHGFGSLLLKQGLKQDLSGDIQLQFGRDGLECVIEAPIPESGRPRELDLQAGG